MERLSPSASATEVLRAAGNRDSYGDLGMLASAFFSLAVSVLPVDRSGVFLCDLCWRNDHRVNVQFQPRQYRVGDAVSFHQQRRIGIGQRVHRGYRQRLLCVPCRLLGEGV